MIKKRIYLNIITFVLLSVLPSMGQNSTMDFNNLTNRDGLSNCQVKAILQDDRGYVWFGTQAGLDRYDGFRFKTFLYNNASENSLPNNSVDGVQQDVEGNLWVHTGMGYCIYQYEKEQFDRHPENWLAAKGIKDSPSLVFIDSHKNMWIAVNGKGCYFLQVSNNRSHFFPFSSKTGIPRADVCNITELNGTAVLAFDNGTLCRLDGLHNKVMWVNSYLTQTYHLKHGTAFAFLDSKGNYWVTTDGNCYIYSIAARKWFTSFASFLTAMGIPSTVSSKVLIRDIVKGPEGKTWIATDHDGLFILDYQNKKIQQYLKDDTEDGSISDNSLTKLYVGNNSAVWIGTYKSGVDYYSPSFNRFETLALGDVCAITEDQQGNYWCGTNDEGIVSYNPKTGQKVQYGQAETGLKSDVIVSCITMPDGTMFFGSFNGGLVRYRHGEWKTYFASDHGLCNNSIWCIMNYPKNPHALLLGTLGGGIQIFDVEKETFQTFNRSNSQLPSDYICSFSLTTTGNVMIGHSQNFSFFNIKTHQIVNHNATKDGRLFASPLVNQALMDSRGIIWLASPAGIDMYDPFSGQFESINDINGTKGAVGCAVVEGKDHSIWLLSEFILTHVKLAKNDEGKWDLNMTSYNYLDGLQERQFNYRAAYVTHDGDVVLGGQNGVNVIHPQLEQNSHVKAKALFSGLVLFDHPLMAGEEYEGKVVLDKALDECRELELSYKDNAFTIQLASSEVMVPSRSRFLYRMDGVTGTKWLMTANGRPEITFTNLSAGHYTLQVKVVNGDGSVCDEVSELHIHVRPPFYLSLWAIWFYIAVVVISAFLYKKRLIVRQKAKYERERLKESVRKDRELNEMKLNFFTNVSHELRTPLTLIISPIVNMIREEEDDKKKRKLELIHRNAVRLLALVNQILDFRKMEQNHDQLTLSQIEVVSFIENICNSFKVLGNNKINLQFTATMPKLMASLDADKVGKIVNNLLSNAYKFTPDGGLVSVCLETLPKDDSNGEATTLRLMVADTGKGISDADKQHIFDRFYQVNGTEMQPFGGSGIGLNLVYKFTAMHGGEVQVKDNPGGGSIFIVDLPLKKNANSSGTSKKVEASDISLETGVMKESPLAAEEDVEGKPVVLLVDDSDDFREFMHDFLGHQYHVVEAVNGKDALEKLQQQRPDIILSDVMMPVMDGNQLCQIVKGNAETASIPFVMLTARLAQEHKKEGLENGADDYITKPFDVDMLSLRIQNLLKWAQRSHDNKVSGLAEETEKSDSTVQNEIVGEETSEQQAETPLNEVKEYVMTEMDKKFMDSVDIYIRDNISDPEASVEAMSSYMCMSRVQLYKRMVSLTGTTPSEYMRNKRIHYAEELLHTNDYTISEIAYKVGFNNPRYFSKYFQEEYGMTPSQYRKKLLFS